MSRILLDTNLLTRPLQPIAPHHAAAVAALNALKRAGNELCIAPQNLYEFYVVATRPVTANGGFGMDPAAAAREIGRIEAAYTLLPDTPDILPRWKMLLVPFSLMGKVAHDARLVAAMEVHGLTQLLTFNDADFRRFGHITLMNPVQYLAPPAPPSSTGLAGQGT